MNEEIQGNSEEKVMVTFGLQDRNAVGQIMVDFARGRWGRLREEQSL